MPHLTVALLSPPGYGKGIGKRGTETDIGLYDMRRDEDTITLVEPTSYPDKLRSLFHSVSLAGFAVLVVDALDRELGEKVLVLDLMGLDRGLVVLRNYITGDQLVPLLQGTKVSGYRMVEDDPVHIREAL